MKIPSLLLVFLLVLACVNPVAALDQQFDDTYEDLDGSSPNKVVWLNDPACTPGNPFGACALGPAVVVAAPALGQGTYIVLAATGAVIAMVQVSPHSPSSSLDAMGTWFKDAVRWGLNDMQESGNFVWSTVVHQQHQKIDIYTQGSEEYHLLHKQLDQLERDYNDAKEKGRSVPGKGRNWDTTGHGMDPKWQVPYSSQQLFHNQVDKDKGCPKQIRYYGKDGKAEMDIDFGHSPVWVKGKLQPLPHKHRWRSDGTRIDEHFYDGIDEIIKYWKCKDYDYKNHRFKESAL